MFSWQQCWEQVLLVLWRMVKKVIHVLTGRSEIERILMSPDSSPREGAYQLYKSLSRSKKLSTVYDIVSSSSPDPERAFEEVSSLKMSRNLDEERSELLHQYIIDVCDVTAFIHHVRALKEEAYDSTNAEHEKTLERMWNAATDNQARAGRITPSWGQLGFQGKDPSTDFRGGGFLSLKQLVYLCETRTDTVKRQLKEPELVQARYPWACVGINLTAHAVLLLNDRLLDRTLYRIDNGAKMERFHEFYCDLFEYFHHRWIHSDPQNVMDFPKVFEESMADARLELENNGSLKLAVDAGE